MTSSRFALRPEGEFPGPVLLMLDEYAVRMGRETEEQIACALKQAETGTPEAEALRRMKVSEHLSYRSTSLSGQAWRARVALGFARSTHGHGTVKNDVLTPCWTGLHCLNFGGAPGR